MGRDPARHGGGSRARFRRYRRFTRRRSARARSGDRASPSDRYGGRRAMIVFDLACNSGHVFEAWFGSTDDYEDQRTRGLVSCPLCGAKQVAKAVMAPNVGPKGNQAPAVPAANTV